MRYIVAALVMSGLILTGSAWAQDDLDIDMLLADFDSFAEEAPAADDAIVEEAFVEEFPAEETFSTAEEAFSFDDDDAAFVDALVGEEEPAIEEDPFADLFGSSTPDASADEYAAEDDFDATWDDDSADYAESSSFAAEDSASDAPVVELSPEELKKQGQQAAQHEEVRRQANETQALKDSQEAFRKLSAEDYAGAEALFTKALLALPDREATIEQKRQIRWGLAESQYLRARELTQKGEDLVTARKLLDSSLSNDSAHQGALALDKRLSKLEERARLPKRPKDQKAFVDRQKSVSQMYKEAREWYKLKDYDRAKALFDAILEKDPYHKGAVRHINMLESKRYRLAESERHARRQEMLTDVSRSWSPPLRDQILLPAEGPDGATTPAIGGSERLLEKMRNIIIPSVEFRAANINDVVDFLVKASIAGDPEQVGVNIVLNLDVPNEVSSAPVSSSSSDWSDDGWGDYDMMDMGMSAAPSTPGVRAVTLNLRRISMLDAIKYITEVAGLKYRVEDTVVMITPMNAPIGQIVTRMYPVQPSIIDVIINREGSTQTQDRDDFTSIGRINVTKSDVKEFFQNAGVQFPAGASITYNSTISQLIVANTADNLETFERILKQLNVIPYQVEIEARFIEVAQNDLEELGLQWILNDNYEFATKADGQRMQVNANSSGFTQGLRFFGQNTDNGAISAISTVGKAVNQTMLGGILSASSVLTNPEVTVVLQALSQHGGSDLLSAPRVTTRSGVNAQIQVVKEIIYPTEFEVTQPTIQSEGSLVTPPTVTPGEFVTRETGVILNVTPTVGPDGYTIDLIMAPEVAELVDWIQYGSEISLTTGVVGARETSTFMFNMPQPVFSSRNVTTSIVIWDGQTVVMGGLIREELTTYKDKVPILGDIPILGWFFRSEGQYSQKMNLLIFVTARLVDPAGRPIHRGDTTMPGSGVDAASADLMAR